MKTFNKKDVYSWSNAEKAKQYINKMGFFAENLTELQDDIEHYKTFQLYSINTKDALATFASMNFCKPLFLPADKVTEVQEKKEYRPFKNLEEFKTELNGIEYGDVVRFREKSGHAIEHYGGYLGHSEKDGQLLAIALGAFLYSPKKLFEHYEFLNKGEWQPFGIEVKGE